MDVDPGRLRRFHASRVDVVFRPSAEEALKTAYLTEIWGDEVVVKDVAVDPPLPRQERRNE